LFFYSVTGGSAQAFRSSHGAEQPYVQRPGVQGTSNPACQGCAKRIEAPARCGPWLAWRRSRSARWRCLVLSQAPLPCWPNRETGAVKKPVGRAGARRTLRRAAWTCPTWSPWSTTTFPTAWRTTCTASAAPGARARPARRTPSSRPTCALRRATELALAVGLGLFLCTRQSRLLRPACFV